MALGGEPELLVMDEPTTNLDVTTEATILDLVRDLVRERGTAVLYVSHSLGVVATLCDRVAVLYAGELVEAADVAAAYGDRSTPTPRGCWRACRASGRTDTASRCGRSPAGSRSRAPAPPAACSRRAARWRSTTSARCARRSTTPRRGAACAATAGPRSPPAPSTPRPPGRCGAGAARRRAWPSCPADGRSSPTPVEPPRVLATEGLAKRFPVRRGPLDALLGRPARRCAPSRGRPSRCGAPAPSGWSARAAAASRRWRAACVGLIEPSEGASSCSACRSRVAWSGATPRPALAADGVPELRRRAQPLPHGRRDACGARCGAWPAAAGRGGGARRGGCSRRSTSPPPTRPHARRAVGRRAAAGRDRPGLRQPTRPGRVRRVGLGPRRLRSRRRCSSSSPGCRPSAAAPTSSSPTTSPWSATSPTTSPSSTSARHGARAHRGGAAAPVPPLHRGAAVGRADPRPGLRRDRVRLQGEAPSPVDLPTAARSTPAARASSATSASRRRRRGGTTRPAARASRATSRSRRCAEVQRPLFDLGLPADRRRPWRRRRDPLPGCGASASCC
jgi:hypothetical protein